MFFKKKPQSFGLPFWGSRNGDFWGGGNQTTTPIGRSMRKNKRQNRNPIPLNTKCTTSRCLLNKRLRYTSPRIPHPWVVEHMPRNYKTVTPEQLAHELKFIGQRPARLSKTNRPGGSLFSRIPTKSVLRQTIQHWTRYHNDRIALARRKGVNITTDSLQVDWAMAAYMRDFSLRAPMMPIKARNPLQNPNTRQTQQPPRYLYRGVGWYVPTGVGSFRDKSYTSWSTNPQTAGRFGLSRGALRVSSTRVYRLDISTIPRGTPWIWFSGKGATLKNGWNISLMGDVEDEVVLPPGTLNLVNPSILSKIGLLGRRVTGSLGNGRATVIDVKFQPDRNATAIWVPPRGRPLKIFK